MSETHNDTIPENSVSRVSPSPGEILRRERDHLGLPLSDVAEALNLRPAVVDGLEHDNYDEIPVPAYRRGYLRAYARHLGMDEQEVLDAYKAQAGSNEPERKVTSIQASRPPSRLGAWLFKLVTLLVIVGLVVVTAIWWQSRGGNEPPGFGDTSSEYEAGYESGSESVSEETGSQTDSEAPADPSEDSPESPSATQDETAQAMANRSNAMAEEEAADAMAEEEAADAMASRDSAEVDPIVPQAGEEPTQGVASPASEATAEAETETAANESAEEQETAPATNANTLELSFNEQSWTEVFDATNQRILVGLQSPDTQVSVEGQPPFRLTIGNATGVELRYQGEPVDLPARAGANNVARFTLEE